MMEKHEFGLVVDTEACEYAAHGDKDSPKQFG